MPDNSRSLLPPATRQHIEVQSDHSLQSVRVGSESSDKNWNGVSSKFLSRLRCVRAWVFSASVVIVRRNRTRAASLTSRNRCLEIL